MSANPRDIILEPVISEKSYDLIEDHNTYTFLVDRRANKTAIRQAVSEVFGVTVLSVNTMNRQGKRKRTGYTWGRRKHTKRALVRLPFGQSIDIFGV